MPRNARADRIDRLPSGAYRARISLGGTRFAATFGSEPRAALWLAELRARYAHGEPLPATAGGAAPASRPRTVGDQLAAFLAALRPTGEVSAKTWAEHERNAHVHLAALAPLALVELDGDPDRLRRHLAALALPPHHLAPRTIRRVLSTLRRALHQAVLDGHLARNVAALVPPPRAPRPVHRVLSRTEQQQLRASAERHSNLRANLGGTRFAALWALALGIGLRLSEALGLTWDDVDLDAGTVTIWRQLGHCTGRRPAWKDSTKTEAGVAPLPLPAFVVAALRRHQARQDGERLRWAGAHHDWRLVFATRYGTPLNQSHVLTSWQRACRRAGVPVVKFHEARHTAASTYLKAGVQLAEVSQILRHASPAVTAAIYAHSLLRSSHDAASALDAFMGAEENADERRQTAT